MRSPSPEGGHLGFIDKTTPYSAGSYQTPNRPHLGFMSYTATPGSLLGFPLTNKSTPILFGLA